MEKTKKIVLPKLKLDIKSPTCGSVIFEHEVTLFEHLKSAEVNGTPSGPK